MVSFFFVFWQISNIKIPINHITLPTVQPKRTSSHSSLGCRSSEPTMPSAYFCQPFPSPPGDSSTCERLTVPPIIHTHLHTYARRIYSHAFRKVHVRKNSPSSSDMAVFYAASVHQNSPLHHGHSLRSPEASFRFPLATDTLTVRLPVSPPPGS